MIEQINSAAGGWWAWMVPMLWQTALLAAFVLAIDTLPRRRGWPQVRYALWLLVLVRLVVPPSFSLATSLSARLLPLKGAPPGVVETAAPLRPSAPAAAVAVAPSEAAPATVRASVETASAAQPVRSAPLSSKAWAMLASTAVSLFFMGWLIARLARLRRMAGGTPAPEWIAEAIAHHAAQLHLQRRPRAVMTDALPSAAVCGLFRPVLFLPESYLGLPREALGHILLHELAHVKRGDLIVNAAQSLLHIVYWFNPALWFAARRLRQLREICCDAAVANVLRERTRDYCATLVHAAERAAGCAVEPGLGLLGLFEGPGRLHRRIEQLARPVWKHRRLKRIAAVAAVALTVLCVLPMAALKAAPQAAPEDKAPPAARDTYAVTLEGKVTDAATGTPVPDAEVRGWICLTDSRPDRAERSAQQTVRTNPNGAYRIDLHSPLNDSGEDKGTGLAALSICAEGYGTHPVFVKPRVSPDNLALKDIDAALQRGRKLSGRILDAEGLPVEGARLMIGDGQSGGWDDWAAWGRAESDKDGLFTIWLDRARRRDMGESPWLAVIKDGYGAAFLWDILGKEEVGDIALKPGGTARGRVLDDAGKPIAGGAVDAFLYPFGRVGRAVTNADGAWEMTGLPGEPSIADFFQRKNKRYMKRLGETAFYVRPDPSSGLADQPDRRVMIPEGRETVLPDIVPGGAARKREEARIAAMPKPADPVKAELIGRVELLLLTNGPRDVTARKTLDWSDVTTDEKGNRSIQYHCYATIWDKDTVECKYTFTFDPEGNLINTTSAEGYPAKVEPAPADTATQDGLVALVEKFFTQNFADITARKTIEWGRREAEADGNVSIRYKYEATIWGKDKIINNQVFTFDSEGKFLSVDNVEGYPKDAE
jgi:beta-lactamase regulating signal transducer with metallopeptidase domain